MSVLWPKRPRMLDGATRFNSAGHLSLGSSLASLLANESMVAIAAVRRIGNTGSGPRAEWHCRDSTGAQFELGLRGVF